MKIEKGCKAFITGAASGIGRSTAIEMGRLGARLFLTDINEKGLAETAKALRDVLVAGVTVVVSLDTSTRSFPLETRITWSAV